MGEPPDYEIASTRPTGNQNGTATKPAAKRTTATLTLVSTGVADIEYPLSSASAAPVTPAPKKSTTSESAIVPRVRELCRR